MRKLYILPIIFYINILLLGQSIDSVQVKSPEFNFITIHGEPV